MNKPGFLFVSPWDLDKTGGVVQVIVNLYQQVMAHGDYRPMVLIGSWHHKKFSESVVAGRRTFHFRLRPPFVKEAPMKNLAIFLATLPFALARLRNFLITNHIEVVNIHFPGMLPFNFVLLKLLGLYRGKIILSFHGMDIVNASKTRGIEAALWKFNLRLSDAIIACSESLRNEVVAFVPDCSYKAKAVHNGLDVQFLMDTRDISFQIDGRLQEKPFILNIATYEYKKGQDVLIKAFSKVAGKFPDLQLVLIGRPSNAQENLHHLASNLGLQDRILLLGEIAHTKIPSFLEHATLFCLSSRYEPFGIVLLEAGLFGLPVVATKVGGIVEIIEDNHTGLLVEPESSRSLEDALTKVLENPDLRRRLGSNLKEHVLQNFNWARSYNKYLQVVTEH